MVCCRNREYVYSVAVYQKYLTRFGELINLEPRRENDRSPDRGRYQRTKRKRRVHKICNIII